jgi:hypothetical protein
MVQPFLLRNESAKKSLVQIMAFHVRNGTDPHVQTHPKLGNSRMYGHAAPELMARHEARIFSPP